MKVLFSNFLKDRKAVSPVIGVILMVAATIVIAAIVMGYLGTFTPPKKNLDVMATNVEIYEDTNNHWWLKATLTGADVDIVTRDPTHIRVSIVNLNNNEANTTTLNQGNITGDIILVNMSNDQYLGTVHLDGNDRVHVTITYVPTGQPLFDGVVVARGR